MKTKENIHFGKGNNIVKFRKLKLQYGVVLTIYLWYKG